MSVESGWPLAAPPGRAMAAGDPETVGPYRIESVLGDGTMGRLYLGRTAGGAAVAVRVLRPEFADRAFRQRLDQELVAIRRVPGLFTAPLVAADPSAEPPWLASAYVAGPSLHQAVTEHGPRPAEVVLLLVAGVAEAVRALHSVGVVHGNLTPANILLTSAGLRLTDFGVTRAFAGTTVTRTGSPAFLAPEEIRGDLVTGAADVFALGSVAYFAATGRPAFGGGHAQAVTYRIMEQQPDLTGCPDDLRDLILACLDKDPARRPTLAAITAPPTPAPAPAPPPVPTEVRSEVPPVPPRVPQGVSRRGLLLGAAGVAALGIGVPLLWPDGDTTEESAGNSSRPRDTGPFRTAATLTGHTSTINSLTFSHDGRRIATMSGEDVRLWDVATGSQRAVLTGPGRPAFGTAFTPDGRLLATGDDQNVLLWDVASREPRTTLSGHTGGITDVAFSPDGLLVASASEDGTVRLWDVRTGQQTAVLGGHNGTVGGVEFHPNGRQLASCASWAVLLWDIPSGRQQHVLDDHENLWTVAYSPDGAILAAADAGSGESGGSVVLRDTAAVGERKAVLGGEDRPTRDLAFSPDGLLLAAAGGEQVIFWDVADAKPRLTLDTGDEFGEVAFAPNGAVATSSDATVTLWTFR